jgi:transcriptional/translational regulatory protein YebC/TACO1
VIDADHYSEDDLMAAVEAGAEDISTDDDVFEVIAEPADLGLMRLFDSLEDSDVHANFDVSADVLERVAG